MTITALCDLLVSHGKLVYVSLLTVFYHRFVLARSSRLSLGYITLSLINLWFVYYVS